MSTEDSVAVGVTARSGTDPAAPDLAREAGPLEVFAQALAAAAPSVAIAGAPGALFLVAGNGTLLSIVLGTVIVGFVAYTLSLQARRTVTSGSLATYAGNGLGPVAAFASGWGLFIGYAAFVIQAFLGAVVYSGAFLDHIGVDPGNRLVEVVLVVAAFVPAAYSAYRGLKLSARVAISLEVVSLIMICVIFVASIITEGFHLDTDQLSAKGATSSGVLIGAVLAVSCYAGFESAAALGRETKDAHRTISRVLLRIVGGLALLYLVASYTEILGFAKLTGASAPLQTVSEYAHVTWTSYPVDITITVSMVAFAAAIINAGARMLFTFAEEGVLPPSLARVHPVHRTPAVAVGVVSVIGVVGALVFVFVGTGPLLATTYTATVGTFGFLTAYLLTTIATPIWLRRQGALSTAAIVASVLGAAGIVYVLYKSVVPAPPAPYNRLPYVYVAILVVGLAFYAALAVRDPQRARQVGTTQETLD